MRKPNLFTWATSELSQDAFIIWLLDWANYPEGGALHKIAIELINTLTDNKIAEIKTVHFEPQRHKIDILCIINDKYALLIEDKTNTSNHSGQLERYLEKLSKEFSRDLIFPVYFKTGDQSDFDAIEQLGYKLFLRNDFLKVLSFGLEQGVSDSIFLDYYEVLNNKEESFQSYKTLPVAQWHWDSWKGFYSELQKQLGAGGWDYVPQNNGGFLGFWWNWKSKTYEGKKFDYYLQLEHNKFCFKIKVEDKADSYQIRDYYRSLLYPKAKEHNVAIYQNGRVGKTMTVAVLEEPYIAVDKNGFLDMDSTIKNIRFVEELMEDV